MRRIMLTVAYDGTNYHGWQIQPNVITIESVLNEALSLLFKEEIHVIGASRTDTGVHALGNIAVFDTEARMPGDKVSYALNQRLPQDIRIENSREVPLDFHPRHCNSRKTYEYKILNREFPLPTYRLYAHFTYVPLDVTRMQQAADYLVDISGTYAKDLTGMINAVFQWEAEHDFKSFCSVNTVAETTVRTLYSVKVSKESDMITIRVTGSGFLYNMVRIIAGTLMEVGKGSMSPEQIPQILAALDRQKAGPTAPACGLTLYAYEFEKR